MNKIDIFLNDKPIESSLEDRLDRTNFSYYLAKAVLENRSKDNLVIGLYGKWGSGKTSILNLFCEHLKKLKRKDKPVIVRFNPWNFSDQNQLLNQFFNVLSQTLKRTQKGEVIKNITRKIDVYSKALIPLKMIPGLGNTFNTFQDLINQVNETLKLVGKQLEQDLFKIRKELTDLLFELKYKIIVIIDDIDRLNNSEIKQIFQLVKAIADFPNTIYVLAFDRDVVVKAIEKVQEGEGTEYLEKIIQVPFEIPSLPREKIHSYLFSELEKLKIDQHNCWKQSHWSNVYNAGIKNYYNTLRDVNRFLNIFKFNYGLIKEEINPIDLIGIIALQLFENKIYEDIRNNKKIYTGVFDSLLEKQDKEKTKEHIKQLLTAFGDSKSDYLKSLLSVLFPKLESFLGLLKMNYTVEHLNIWEKENRICSPKIFDTYFCLSIDENDVSNTEMNNIIKVKSDYKKLGAEINKFQTNKKFNRFLEKLWLHLDNENDSNNIENILKVLTNSGDKYIDHQLDWYSSSIFQVFHIHYYLMNRIENDKRFKMMENMINNLTNSVYTIVYILQFEYDNHNDGKTEESKYLFTPEQLIELTKLMKNKIIQFYRLGKLYDHPSLEGVLSFLKNNGGLEDIKEMNDEYLNSYYRLANFLNGFKGTVRSQSSSDYGYRYSYYYNLENIKNYVDIDKLEKMAREFYKSKEFAELSTEQILNIKLLIDCFDGKVKPPR